jgi:demethylmenaquinone methyltransferase/2-methoxy-6-polyprenyl-1,4-benzoquinol methylase
MQEKKVICGSEYTSVEEKKTFVNHVFSGVYQKYDLMNDLMSLGIHRLWKTKFVDLMRQHLIYRSNPMILDVASGTGDIPIKFLKSSKIKGCKIILSDINPDMLQIAKNRITDLNLFNNCDFLTCDAAQIPLEDNSMDLYTTTFGARNISDLDAAIAEAYRILKPYGYFMCMEFSPINGNNFVKSKIYNTYLDKIIPLIGERITNNREAYEYLSKSIQSFLTPEEFATKLSEHRFENIKVIQMNFGIVSIHIGCKSDKKSL